MPKLTRYLQKIFANNSNQVGVFGTGVDKETSKNVETLQSADYEEGWSSAIITNKNYPIWQEMDGVQYGLSYQLKYLFQNGVPEWLSTETYYTNSYCRVGSTIYYSLQDNNTNHNPALDDGYWTPLLTSNRSIGEIIPSCVPLTEAGLHLLDGALISSGMYADFVTYMANLTATAPECFCTEAEWQQSVTTYGVCGKFVYDSVNNTVRLPKYSNKIYTKNIKSTASVVGNGNALGLYGFAEGQTGSISYLCGNGVGDNHSFFGRATGTNPAVGNTLNGNFLSNNDKQAIGVTRNASTSGLIALLSDITTSLEGYYYIVIATSTKTDIQVDIDEIATDLNGKADVDLTNATDQARILMGGMAMPSNTYIQLTLGASGSAYTAPANGWFAVQEGTASQNTMTTLKNTTKRIGTRNYTPQNWRGGNLFVPVNAGDTVSLEYVGSGYKLYFIYTKGSESEAQ